MVRKRENLQEALTLLRWRVALLTGAVYLVLAIVFYTVMAAHLSVRDWRKSSPSRPLVSRSFCFWLPRFLT